MNIPPLVRNIGVGILLVALLFFGYEFTINRTSTTSSGSLVETGPMAEGSSTPASSINESAAIDEAYRHLTFLKNLDTHAVTDNPTLQSLVDYRVPLATSTLNAQTVGRDNPFLPVSGAKGTTASK